MQKRWNRIFSPRAVRGARIRVWSVFLVLVGSVVLVSACGSPPAVGGSVTLVLGAYTAMASPDRRHEKGQRRCNNKRTQGQGEFTGEALFQPSMHAVQ